MNHPHLHDLQRFLQEYIGVLWWWQIYCAWSSTGEWLILRVKQPKSLIFAQSTLSSNMPTCFSGILSGPLPLLLSIDWQVRIAPSVLPSHLIPSSQHDHDSMAFPELYLYRFGLRVATLASSSSPPSCSKVSSRYGPFSLRLPPVLIHPEQSANIHFIMYSDVSVSSRDEGWQVSLYEFSTTMTFPAVLTANFLMA